MAVAMENCMSDNQRLSSADILERFQAIELSLDVLRRVAYIPYTPAPLLIYKPNDKDTSKGSALKVELRAAPAFDDGGFLKQSSGGLFIELAAQTGIDERDNAQFNWKRDNLVGTPQQLITAKLGLPDITASLLAHDLQRNKREVLPESLRSSRKVDGRWVKDPEGRTLSMTHKFKDATTIIEWRFADRGSLITVSKTRDTRRTVSMTLPEELAYTAYLRKALDVFFDVGMR